MSLLPIITLAAEHETDVVLARQRTRQISQFLKFDNQDQTRIATAVSEVVRNATAYGGGGRVHIGLESGPDQTLVIEIKDKGPGIADVEAVLSGRYQSTTGMGVGLAGTRRLMDQFNIETGPGKGVVVRLGKRLPRGAEQFTPESISKIVQALKTQGGGDPLEEVRSQNQELMASLDALNAKQEETERLNQELDRTNKGMIALHAELDGKAEELRALNVSLEDKVAAAVRQAQLANDALRQSQKMEAVGQLTGGIAHDFNNLLQVVTGNLEMLRRGLPEDASRLHRAADNAMQGAQRAATLTQRLLAFSRRQPLDPKPLDPNRLVDGMLELMRRTIGEPITVETRMAPQLWSVRADANQLENALLNLAVNARDAMNGAGRLTITTSNALVGEKEIAEDAEAVPGRYVAIAVCDTGAGMSRETMARVLEPFFTTKDVGKGTGLGLSMVYGFARQSGGHLRIESAVGHGTTVTIYIPMQDGPVEIATENAHPATITMGHGQTILVLEDDDDVRATTVEMLHELGYHVLQAGDGQAAVEIIRSEQDIALLFTDAVLAGALTSDDVAREMATSRPRVPVLFTSGYAHDVLQQAGRLDKRHALVSKPFTVDVLAESVGKALLHDPEA